MGGHKAMFDRRTAITALGAGAILTVQPGCARASGASPHDAYLVPIRALLAAVTDGRLAEFLNDSAAPRPIISGLDAPVSLKGQQLPVETGNYIVRSDRRVVDLALPAAVKATGGAVANARFSFVEQGGKPVLRTAAFGPDAEMLYTRIAPGTAVAEVQRRYDELAAHGGGTLWFAPGTHRIALVLRDRNVRIAGAGMGATILSPAAADRPVIEGAYNSGSWSLVAISDLSFVGTGKGTGFQAGHVPRMPADEFIGRTRFENVRFTGFDICLARPAGQIGLWLQNCVFEGAGIHLQAIGTLSPGEPMHAGNLVARDCYFAGAQKAVLTVESPVTGTGQITFDNCIMELNPGYVFHVSVMNGVEGVPAMLVRSCWNEVNATAASVTLGGTTQKPVYGLFSNSSLVRFEDTPLGNLALSNATVETADCALDLLKSVTKDKASTLVHRAARGFGTFAPVGLVESVAATYQFGPNRALSFEMPVRSRKLVGAGAAMLATASASASRRVIDLKPGERVALQPATAIPAGSWVAWAFDCRHAAGAPASFGVQGSGGIASNRPIDHVVPRTLAGMSFCETALTDVHFELSADTRGARVEVGAFALARFDRREDALAFVNGRIDG